MRNEEAHFSALPKVEIKRSLFSRTSQLKTSFNVGELIPIYADEYLPGDTFSMDTAIVLRTSTMLKPVMDNLFADVYYFAVPNRLVWQHWKEFMGENTTGPWTQQTEYTIPQVTAPSGGWAEHTIADYFGIPTKVSGISITSLFFRAYALIWNEYFRDQNLQNPTDVPRTDATEEGTNGNTLETAACKGGMPLPVNKVHDYFTSALPQTQKHDAVTIPLGTTSPIVNDGVLWFKGQNSGANMQLGAGANIAATSTGNAILWNQGSAAAQNGEPLVYNTGLKVDLTNATAATINALRLAFQTQRLYEKDARGGTRSQLNAA